MHQGTKGQRKESRARALLAATAMQIAPRAVSRFRLERRLTAFWRRCLDLSDASVRLTTSEVSARHPHRVILVRDGGHIDIQCCTELIVERAGEAYHRLCAVLAVAGALRSCRFIADVSDGEESDAGLVSFCSRDPAAILIPDHSFIQTSGYERHRELARANATPWHRRSEHILWRGTTTGPGRISKEHMTAGDRELLPRVRLCLSLRDVPGTDVKLSAIAQSGDVEGDRERLICAGILGDYIAPITWHGCKFAIDIDGNSNAWSNLFTRLIMGCCLLKVASAPGYRQWYYDELDAWTHYVPVKADLSDLRERIDWCRAHLSECGDIAARGQQFAMARGLDREIDLAAQHIRKAEARGALRTTLG
jgi:hypothetical protein